MEFVSQPKNVGNFSKGWLALLIATATFLSVCCSHTVEFDINKVTLIWPAGAFAFWFIYRFGAFALLPVFLGTDAYHWLMLRPFDPSFVLISITNTFSAWCAVVLYQRLSTSDRALHSVRDVMLLLGPINLVQSLGSAVMGVIVLGTVVEQANTLWYKSLFLWVMSDATGIILTLPFLMAISLETWSWGQFRRALPEAVIVFLLLVGVFCFSRSDYFDPVYQYPALLASLPVSIWIALRKNAAVSISLLSATVLGCLAITFFSVEKLDYGLILFAQLYAALVMACGLILNAVSVERNDALESSREHLYALEKIVAARTEALREKIRETEALAVRLREQSHTDYLTSIANRRAFVEFAEMSLLSASSHTTYIFLIDIDYFKSINDRYGHDSGDACLVELAALLTSAIPKENSLAARIGGEEFSLIVDCASEQDGIAFADKIRQHVERLRLDAKGKDIGFTVSIGVAKLSRKSNSVDLALRMADQALYRAKREGRNRVIMHGIEHYSTDIDRQNTSAG